MSKMRYFNKFSKIAKRWGLCAPSAQVTSDFGDLKLRDLSNLCFFKRIMTQSNFKKSVMTSFQ